MDKVNINGATLRDMILTGAALLEKNKSLIDSLNVFPVPDGDTGTNMSMTMQGAAREVRACESERVCDMASAAALGSLKGARGNSGVILSQILRGFAKALTNQNEMDSGMLALALTTGTEAAYKAVMKPKEGTMLTVARLMAERANELREEGANVYKMLDLMLERGEEALKQTPELLPVLKEAGVVDSGGKGLLTIFHGFKMALDGEDVDDYFEANAVSSEETEADIGLEDVEDIKFGYCTEFFIVHLDPSFCENDLDHFREKLMKIGDSVVVANDADFIKVHVHSNAPGKILQMALRLGELDKLKIENMREQNREILRKMKEREKENAMIAVSVGDGIDCIFKELGVEVTIEGGQTMNPSIDTIKRAIRKANARNVFVLPNNGNIILAAQQAAELSECKVFVMPTKSVMQGISAAMAFMPDADAEDNKCAMQDAADAVTSGAVTFAVRDTSVEGKHISKGDLIGMMNGKIVEVNGDVAETAEKLLCRMCEGREDPIVTILYGKDVDEKAAKELSGKMEELLPDAEITVREGGQPLYYYYLAVE